MVVDLLMLTGLPYEEAREYMPEPMGADDLTGAPDADSPVAEED
jgi:hypothetical protein